ncbi:5-formyltetrahydrofolate cyclo-ligase [Microcoleus sp. PH2017_02_FOX_O_A]|uniref:5-formyltetrahydrofolate cyclo-ligase n=1 Tax=Microcoleus sp. PH2017_02_FOX_O_A TaxID=2798813 RepID=UPI0025E3E4E8|nr:5-formyltetrahydrofolate cyclo-ligase [Microcoleus sp. PH2017_02_FOX_O_A]
MNTSQPSLTKTELRRSLLNTRKSLSAPEWRQKSEILCNHLHNSPLFTEAKTILAYFSFRQPAQFWRQARCLSHKCHSHP